MTDDALRDENRRLRAELTDAKEALRAVAAGQADAVRADDQQGPVLLRAAQDALRRREQLFRAVFEGSMDAIVLLDDEGRVVDANAAALRLVDRPHEELIGTVIEDLAHAPSEVRASFCELLERGSLRGLATVERTGGEHRLVEYSAVAGIVPTRHLAVLRDVTERRQHERARARAEARLTAIVDELPVVLFALDENGVFTFVQAEGLRDERLDPNELLGKSAFDLYGGHDFILEDGVVVEGREATRRVLAGDSIRGLSQPADGLFFETRLQPTRNQRGEITGAQGVAIDVTQRVRAERELKRRDRQLRTAQRMEGIGRLAGGIAHDFNNLLVAIRGFAEFLYEDLPPDDERRDDASEILATTDRASRLTQQLLAFSRRQRLAPETFEVNAMVTGVERLLRRIIGEDVEVVLTRGEASPQVHADRGQLEQVLVNLAVNARDAMPEGGSLHIATDVVHCEEPRPSLPPGPYARIRVSDTGCGMDDETLGRIFEPFFTTKDEGRGTGLGLATAYGIVRQTGGTMEVDSRPGQGTTFDVLLPCEGVGEPAARSLRPSSPAAALTGSERVLVVEDEEVVRRLVAQILRRAGFEVLTAGDAQRAKAIAAREPAIHLLLTDIIMPGQKGPDLARELCEQRPELRVVFMTGHAQDEEVEGGPVLFKPFGRRELLEVVRGTLDGAIGAAAER